MHSYISIVLVQLPLLQNILARSWKFSTQKKLFSNIRLLKERTRILEFKGGESDNVIWGKDYGGIITRRNRCELETKIHLCFSKFLETLNEKEILRINPAKIQFL